ncbi:GDSL-type esterase/lipase family protein [Shimazuella sp. AN120528]|uniref:GDSL-type esterase/lipase family protein n=1 Tax=Shimazuella soli TaxID=1892854 RepID=UPI001F108EC7|nr:GDSL-type esterase/lipase family protein [Shimazuella soli]MCH5584113.1 GDSL-type esterase/lipase family protein [Shimazuella soli]
MRKKTMFLVYVAAVLCTVFLITGFVLGVKEILLPQIQTAKSTAPSENVSVSKNGLLLGLGDSLTRGIGDSTGKGYIGRLKQMMESKNHSSLSMINLAVSGQTSPQLVKQIRDIETQNFIKKADWITITIGNNDLFRGSGQLENIDISGAQKSLVQYKKNMTQILSTIKNLNPKATVIVMGIYNPFAGLENEKMTSELVADWNSALLKISANYSKIIVVPTFDLFQIHNKQFLSSDHFHPNDTGYQRIADRVFPVIP